MLMECGLGLYDLALLHLVAHSIYKAHAFLSAGETVVDARYRSLLARAGTAPAAGGLLRLLAPVPLCVALMFASVALWHQFVPGLAVDPIALFIFGLGLSPLSWPTGSPAAAGWLRSLAGTTALAQLYLAWHWAFSGLAPVNLPAYSLLPALWAAACLGALYLAQSWLQLHPTGAFSRRLYPWAYGGFFLDERFTRLTFRLWPAPRPPAAPHPIPQTLAIPAPGNRT
jgi:NAD(P)H-quinone oxidoreductase subunit 5